MRVERAERGKNMNDFIEFFHIYSWYCTMIEWKNDNGKLLFETDVYSRDTFETINQYNITRADIKKYWLDKERHILVIVLYDDKSKDIENYLI